NAGRFHTLRSIPLCALPPAEGTLGQVLLPDQGGIVLFCTESCALCRLCLHSVRRPKYSTSPLEVAPPAYPLLDVFAAPCAPPSLALFFASTLFVFSSSFSLAQSLSLLLSQRFAFFLFLAQPLFRFN